MFNTSVMIIKKHSQTNLHTDIRLVSTAFTERVQAAMCYWHTKKTCVREGVGMCMRFIQVFK